MFTSKKQAAGRVRFLEAQDGIPRRIVTSKVKSARGNTIYRYSVLRDLGGR